MSERRWTMDEIEDCYFEAHESADEFSYDFRQLRKRLNALPEPAAEKKRPAPVTHTAESESAKPKEYTLKYGFEGLMPGVMGSYSKWTSEDIPMVHKDDYVAVQERIAELEAELDQLKRDQKREKWLSEADNKEIDALTSERDSLAEQVRVLRETMGSISRNSCCDTCQEAKLFALSALAKADEIAGKKK